MKCYGCTLERDQFNFPINTKTGIRGNKCRQCVADQRSRNKHGLTLDQKIVRAVDQDGCAICGTLTPVGKGWVVDHDRSTCHPGDFSCKDCRRGILCAACNTALGYARDNPTVLRRMADYIELGTRLA